MNLAVNLMDPLETKRQKTSPELRKTMILRSKRDFLEKVRARVKNQFFFDIFVDELPTDLIEFMWLIYVHLNFNLFKVKLVFCWIK